MMMKRSAIAAASASRRAATISEAAVIQSTEVNRILEAARARAKRPDMRPVAKLIRVRKGPKNHGVNKRESLFARKRAARSG